MTRVNIIKARDPSTPVDILDKLAEDEDINVHYEVALNANTRSGTLAKLANDKNIGMQYAVAKNHNTPAEALAKLANTEDPGVQYAIATNPNTSAETLTYIVNNILINNIYSSTTRYLISEHPNCPEAVRLWLKSEGYAGMSLAEFIVATTQETP